MKWVNLLQSRSFSVSQIWGGAHGEELHSQSVWSLNALPGKYMFLCRKSKSSFLSQVASTHPHNAEQPCVQVPGTKEITHNWSSVKN